jgi:hypothetical protein
MSNAGAIAFDAGQQLRGYLSLTSRSAGLAGNFRIAKSASGPLRPGKQGSGLGPLLCLQQTPGSVSEGKHEQ